ncbi:MAG: hypothetical protein R6W78_14205 [Bacteroidales bacterium]
MTQYLIVFLIISISVIYVVVKAWNAVFPAQKTTSSSYCNGCAGCNLKDFASENNCTGYKPSR